MNVKNNKRHQETIAKIEAVFLECLSKQELSQIRVSEICKGACINRSTFYANYADIYALADTIRNRLQTEVDRFLEQDIDWQCSEQAFLTLFRHIRENQKLYRFYFKLGYDRAEGLKLYELYAHRYDIDPKLIKYHICFFKSGFNAMVLKWLEEGCPETPEEMRSILLWEYRGRFQSGAR